MVRVASRLDTPEATRAEQAKHRVAVKGCRECENAGVAGVRVERVPPAYPTRRASFAVVTDRPMLEDATEGRAGSSAGPTLLAKAFKANKVPGADGAAWVTAVACRTMSDASIPEHRRPNAEEKKRCWGWCADGIWHANTDRVLLVGGDAKDLWRPDLTVEQLAGVVGVLWDRYVCMVVDNPMKFLALTGHKKRDAGRRLNEQVKQWGEVVDEDGGEVLEGASRPLLPVTRHMARECVECRGEVDWIDRDGIGWCRAHRNDRWMACRGLDTGHGGQGVLL